MPDTTPLHQSLSRRERQIMDAVFRLGRATATQIHEGIPQPPSLTAVRTMIRNLEEKGHLRHRKDGPRYVYYPAGERKSAARSAASYLLRTFFGGSPGSAMAALLDASERPLTDSEKEELVALIRQSRSDRE